MSLDFKDKYQKYKSKYFLAKQLVGGGMTPEDTMDVIELYNKTSNLYILYRFRYDNTKDLIDTTDLSDKFFTLSKQVKDDYQEYYIKDLLEMTNIKEMVRNPNTSRKIIFTLRQDTTKVIKNLLLINNESIDMINNYIIFMKNNNLHNRDKVYSEIYEKCLQIKGLVTKGTTRFNDNKTLNELDTIRNITNKIINIIGNDYDNTMENLGIKSNNINEINNDLLDRLFKTSFKLLSKKIDNGFCNYLDISSE